MPQRSKRATVAAAVIIALSLVLAGWREARGTTLAAGLREVVVADGFDLPTAAAFLPDGRILVAEKSGLVWVVRDGAVLPAPFVDLRDHVNQYWDRGLTAMAVDPAFATNGWVYFFYPYEHDAANPTGPKTARLTRVTAVGDRGGPETVLLGSMAGDGCASVHPQCIPQDWYGHAADAIAFAPDGTLFLSLGDASTWDHVNIGSLRVQSLDQYPGKILRVTRDGLGVPDNPFYDGSPGSIRSRVWAYGLRNPFRLALRPGSGTLYVGDVGWNTWEEIDVAARGANLGWPCYEGPAIQAGYQSNPLCQALYAQGTARAPLLTWPHAGGSGSVVMGPFTPTSSGFPPEYHGGFFYADYAQDWIRFVQVSAVDGIVGEPHEIATDAGGPVWLGFGPAGDLYYLAILPGELRRITADAAVPPGDRFLSDLTPQYPPLNGWGPIERDHSNGEQAAGDGRPLTIGGQVFAKGLGVHARSEIAYDLAGECSQLTAQVGLDDEVGTNGSVVFDVWGDSRWLFSSGVRRGSDGPLPIAVDVTGVQTVWLVVGSAGDGIHFDHADWADARVRCGADEEPPAPRCVSDLTPVGTPVNGWGPVERDRSNGEALAGDGGPLVINGQTFTKGLGVHARSEAIFDLGGTCTAFVAQVGVDDEVGTRGSVRFEVWNDTGARLFDSGVRRGGDDPLAVAVDVTGVVRLRLVVTDAGDGIDFDHADWADARVMCGADGNASPLPIIDAPAGTDRFQVGQTVALSGRATDPEDGVLPASALRWTVTVEHCPGGDCHTHPFLRLSGAGGSFQAPDHGTDTHLRIRLEASDSAGAVGAASRNLLPQTARVVIATMPPGLPVIVDGAVVATPYVTDAIVGSSHSVEAPSPQAGRTFVSWSDGGARQHVVQIPETGLSLTAIYAPP